MQKVITVAHQKGGVGKSTVARNLAVELAKRYPLTIVDLDYQKSLTIFNEHRKERGLAPLSIANIKSERDLMRIIDISEGIVLIDSGGFDSDLNRIALLGADLIVTPLSNNLIEIYGLEAFKKILQELRSAREDLRATVLLNNVNPAATKVIEELRAYIHNSDDYFALFATVLRRRAAFAKSFESGESVVEMDPSSKASLELGALIQEIESLLKQ